VSLDADDFVIILISERSIDLRHHYLSGCLDEDTTAVSAARPLLFFPYIAWLRQTWRH
jgi:hypothetical protein